MAAMLCCTAQPKFGAVGFRQQWPGSSTSHHRHRCGRHSDVADLDPAVAIGDVVSADQNLVAADAHVGEALGEIADRRVVSAPAGTPMRGAVAMGQ